MTFPDAVFPKNRQSLFGQRGIFHDFLISGPGAGII
jgi:hypothetical protein